MSHRSSGYLTVPGKAGVLAAKFRQEGFQAAASTILSFLYYWYNHRILKTEYILRSVHDYRMLLNIQVKGISKSLVLYGCHEKLETELIQQRLKPGMTAIDVGANIGYYALLEACLVGGQGRVYALEPFPRSYELLLKNVRLNSLEDRLECFPLAAGDSEGKVRMYLGASDNVHAMMSYGANENHRQFIMVDAVTLDSFLRGKRSIDFLRMDLEGFECQVLDGMKEVLASSRPDLFFEVHPVGDVDPDPRYTPYLEWLLSLGYRPVTVICPAHAWAMDRYAELGYRPTRTTYSGLVKSARFDGLRSEDLLQVAARRPKITRAVYLSAR